MINKDGERYLQIPVGTMGTEQARLKSLGAGTTEKHVIVKDASRLEEGEIGGREARWEFTEEVLVRTSSGNGKERTFIIHFMRGKLL